MLCCISVPICESVCVSYWSCFGDQLMIQGVVTADVTTAWSLGEQMMLGLKNGAMQAWM